MCCVVFPHTGGENPLVVPAKHYSEDLVSSLNERQWLVGGLVTHRESECALKMINNIGHYEFAVCEEGLDMGNFSAVLSSCGLLYFPAVMESCAKINSFSPKLFFVWVFLLQQHK